MSDIHTCTCVVENSYSVVHKQNSIDAFGLACVHMESVEGRRKMLWVCLVTRIAGVAWKACCV